MQFGILFVTDPFTMLFLIGFSKNFSKRGKGGPHVHIVQYCMSMYVYNDQTFSQNDVKMSDVRLLQMSL